MNETGQTAVLCRSCNGDPRASLRCAQCGGAGIGVPSTEGFLVWTRPLDDFQIIFRKIRHVVTIAIHLALLIIGVGSVGVFAWQVVLLGDFTLLLQKQFWISGQWFVTLFWFGLFNDCFLIFRFSEYLHSEKPIPGWDVPVSRSAVPPVPVAAHPYDVSVHFSSMAMDVVERAYKIARDLGCTEVKPLMIVAATLTTRQGGLFLARLGLSFDKLKQPLARAMSASSHGSPPIALSRDLKRSLAVSYLDAKTHRRMFVGPVEIFLQSFKDSPEAQELIDQLGFPPEHVIMVGEWIRLQEAMQDDARRFFALARLKPKSVMNRAMTARQTPLLDQYSEDLTLLARGGYLPPIVGRDHEVAELLQGIESGRRSVALVGDAGVGKTALIAELARRMVSEDVPPELFDRRLVSVNLAQLIGGGDSGMADDRLLRMLHEVGMSGNIVLVLEGVEVLVGGGGGRGPLDLAEVLSTELDKGYFIAIATTTTRAWTEHLEQRSLGQRLVKVAVSPMKSEDAIRVLMARSEEIELSQGVFFSFAALEKATTLALRYVYEVASPESAMGVIRESAVYARKTHPDQSIVTADDVANVVHEKTGIPVQAVSQDEAVKLLNLEARLHARVIGQEEAVKAVSQAMRRARAELREGKRPIVNLLFLGPTGVGKTELAKALASEYFGDESSMVRVDMSEYQDAASVQRMIGAPGDDRGGLLTEAVRHHPFTIVLFDEIEKAHADILNLFLQVMDDGRLTDGIGRTVDFTNTVIIMTSNAGTSFIQTEVGKATPLDQIRTALIERELKGIFRPEFLNRFDGMIVFKPLTQDDVTQVAWLLIHGIAKRMEAKGFTFIAEDEAVEALAKAGFDPLFGARPLRRVIQDRVDTQLADLILRKEVERRDTVVLQADGTLMVKKK